MHSIQHGNHRARDSQGWNAAQELSCFPQKVWYPPCWQLQEEPERPWQLMFHHPKEEPCKVGCGASARLFSESHWVFLPSFSLEIQMSPQNPVPPQPPHFPSIIDKYQPLSTPFIKSVILYVKSPPPSSPVHCLQFKALNSSFFRFFRQNPCSLCSWLSLQKPWQTAVLLIKWFLLLQGPAASFLWLPNIPNTRPATGRGQERFSKPKLLSKTTDTLGMEISLS